MRKIRIIEHISLDGVIQQESSDDFVYGGWATHYRTPAGLDTVVEAYGSSFDLLLGRHTYDGLANFWPKAGDSPMANGLNAATKYVVTHRPENLEWTPVASLGEDVMAGIRRLKLTNGPNLVVCGSSTLTSILLDQGLVDEVVLIVYPILLGQGKRFFSDVDPCKLAFVGTKTTPTGVLLNTYRYVGSLRAESPAK